MHTRRLAFTIALASLAAACSSKDAATDTAPDAGAATDGATSDAGSTDATDEGDGGLALAPFVDEADILVPGVGVNQSDCRTKICRHNENTDLYRWHGSIWFVHRTANSQILGPNSSLHIYRSDDEGKTFTDVVTIQAPVDRDLRDPEFFDVGDELRIKAITRLPVMSTRDSNVDSISVIYRSKDGVTWSDPSDAAPAKNSFWRPKSHAGVYYSAAYQDGDQSVTLFTSTDGLSWTEGAPIWTVAADTPLETELVFMPSGKLLALVRMDGTDEELLGDKGRLRTNVCWADAPYTKFDCPQVIMGQRLDGPVAFFWNSRLFVVARKHLPTFTRKRTALYEITGTLEGGPIDVVEQGELPSAGDTAYAGAVELADHRVLLTWYSGELAKDEGWGTAMFDATDIWRATIDLTKLSK